MTKVRVHELAKKLRMSNQDLLTKLLSVGIVVKTHSSSVDEEATLQALGLTATGERTSAGQTRTVLRRRTKEEITEPVEPEPSSILEIEEIEENVEEVLAVEEQIEEEPFALPPVLAPKPQVDEAPRIQPVVPKGEKETNVVRVIDAEAIRARLAAEGRTFRPRGQPGPSPIRPVGTPGQVRDIKVIRDVTGPQMVDVTAGPKPGIRPAKRKGEKEDREKRDASSGGLELWMTPGRKKKGKRAETRVTNVTQAAAHKRVVELSGPISVNELAHKMSIKAGQVVSKLMGMGMMVTVNQFIDPETAAIVASEFEYEVKNVAFAEETLIKEEADLPETLVLRAPVVTVMGHVDHGKTSILDALRKADVARHEAGGITQHIGAYMLDTKHGRVTLLDTPGHEAFTAMRARGAKITDIVVLVVAADDGVMPQTLEAIDHAKAANVPVVVAINKIDMPSAKPERVMQQLSDNGLVPEEWGGDTQYFKVSALKKIGLEELMEGLGMQAEIMELKVNPNKLASGLVIEAKLDKGRGPVATVLTLSGTLKQGDHIVVGEHSGRVRAMYDSTGQRVETAGPSEPVQVLGLPGVPMAGDRFNAVEDDKVARAIAQNRAQKARELELLSTAKFSLENFLQSAPPTDGLELRLVVKGDVSGSVEALVSALKGLSNDQVKVSVVHSGVGTITENDINLAKASQAIVIGFNTKPDAKAQSVASQEKVDVRSYNVIYEVVDEVRRAMAGLLAPVIEENYLGKAEVRMVIPVAKFGTIAGCYVQDGKIIRSAKVRLKRNGEVIHQGAIASLKRFKDDVREVTAGYECGIAIEGIKDIQEGDVIECFELKEVEAKLEEVKKKKPEEKSNRDASASAAM